MKFSKFVLAASAVGTFVGVTALSIDSKDGVKYKGEEKIFGKTVIITGANSGLGKVTALELAKRGGRIVLACRDMKKCGSVRESIIEKTYNTNVECKHLDLSSLKSIRDFAADINNNEKRVDVLINNAAVMAPPAKTLTDDGFELQIGVNYLGPFLLTNLLLDKLKSSGQSRILNINCSAFKRGRIDFQNLNSDIFYVDKIAYEQSKLALYASSVDLAYKLKDTGVAVMSVNPGYVRNTGLGRYMNMNKSVISSTLLKPVWAFLMKTPEAGMQTILYCAMDPEAKTSGYYAECQEFDLGYAFLENVDMNRLWAVSEVWTRLKSS